MQDRDAGKRRCGERRWRDCAGILEREHCADGSRPSGFAPYHPWATMQKHEKKRVAGGASCNCLKIKEQICNHERGGLEVASDSWREKEEEKEMKWRRGEGSQVWQTQDLRERVLGSVAMIGVTGDFSEVWQIQDLATFWRKAGVREGGVRSAARRGRMGFSGAGYRRSRVRVAGTQYTTFLLFVKR